MQRVAISRPRESSSSVCRSRAFLRILLSQRNRVISRRSPLVITPMNRPSEAARTAGCAVAKRKPQTGGIFFFHEDTNNAFLLAYRVTSRARIRHRHGRKGWQKGVNLESKYNQTEVQDPRDKVGNCRGARSEKRQLREATNQWI